MNYSITALDFYLLRTPTHSIDELELIHDCGSKEEVATMIHKIYLTESIQEKIYLASPELYNEMIKWLFLPNDYRLKNERLILTLYKYLLRMSLRCTPYGLFAGYSVGNVTNKPTKIEVNSSLKRQIKYARLDMNYISQIIEQIMKIKGVKYSMVLSVNTSLYMIENSYRYYEYRIINKKRNYSLVSIKRTEYLDLIISKAEQGLSYETIFKILTESLKIGLIEAEKYIDQLIDFQILVSDLELTITGEESLKRLIQKIESYDIQDGLLEQLQKIDSILSSDKLNVDAYKQVSELVNNRFKSIDSKNLIQVDLNVPMISNSLNKEITNLLSAEINELLPLSNYSMSPEILKFSERFYARYEDQEIPFLEALDSESGIGYGIANGIKANHTPLIDDVQIIAKKKDQSILWDRCRQLVSKKLEESQQNSLSTIILTDEDLSTLPNDNIKGLPPTFFLMGSILSSSSDELDMGDFKFHLQACHGPGAASLMARFASPDKILSEKLKECCEVEQNAYGDSIVAEIIHLPESRVGNILQRPRLRDYEIVFLGNSSVSDEYQIPVSDLMISVNNGRVILRSKRLNKIIIPSLTTAHNYNGRHNISLYKFLCDLQYQDFNLNVTWNWGHLLDKDRLPRVEYKHIILQRARWKLNSSLYIRISSIKSKEEVCSFLEEYKLPSKVILAEGDNEILIDFNCSLGLEILAQELKNNSVILYESIYENSAKLIADDCNKHYNNELIIPFATETKYSGKLGLGRRDHNIVKRSFSLGSEWTYVKIYCGPKIGDKILTNYLLPCIKRMQSLKQIEDWFFIRYNDPESHIRLRLHHKDDSSIVKLIVDSLNEALSTLQIQRIVTRVQYDTYHREIERYGLSTMEFSESIFYYDSRAVIELLDMLEGEEGEEYRWLFALYGVDTMLSDFGLSLIEKDNLLKQLSGSFFAEFGGGDGLRHQLNEKYRRSRKRIDTFMRSIHDSSEIREAVKLFEERSSSIRNLHNDLMRIQSSTSNPYTKLDAINLLNSYIHMFMNRMFVANQRRHELVIYHYLTKHYASKLAQGN